MQWLIRDHLRVEKIAIINIKRGITPPHQIIENVREPPHPIFDLNDYIFRAVK